MRTVKSAADLHRLALVKGASASVGGVKFNSSSEKVKEFPKPEPKAEVKPDPKPEPKTKPQVDLAKIVEVQTDSLAKSNTQLISEMTRALEKLTPADKPKKWKLTVQRDTRGVLQSIDVEAA